MICYNYIKYLPLGIVTFSSSFISLAATRRAIPFALVRTVSLTNRELNDEELIKSSTGLIPDASFSKYFSFSSINFAL